MCSDLKLTTFEKTMFQIITRGTDHQTETLSDVVSFLNVNTTTDIDTRYTSRNEILTALAEYVVTTREIHSKVQSVLMDRLKSVNVPEESRADIWHKLVDGSLDFQQFHVPTSDTVEYTGFPVLIMGQTYFDAKKNRIFTVFNVTSSGELEIMDLFTEKSELYIGPIDSFLDGTYSPVTTIDTSDITAVGDWCGHNFDRIRDILQTSVLGLIDNKLGLFTNHREIRSYLREWMSVILDPNTQRGTGIMLNIGEYKNIFPTDISPQKLSTRDKLQVYWFNHS